MKHHFRYEGLGAKFEMGARTISSSLARYLSTVGRPTMDRMKRFVLFSVLLISLLCALIFSWPSPARSDDEPFKPTAGCPSREELKAELARQGKDLLTLKVELDALLSGENSIEIAPQALLLVDLDDADAIQRRKLELKKEIELFGSDKGTDFDPVLQCSLADEQLNDLAQRVIKGLRIIASLRLQFLQLPEARRKALLHFQASFDQEEDLIKRIKKNRMAVLQEKAESMVALRLAENTALFGSTEDIRRLAEERVLLEKAKLDTIDYHLESNSEVEKRARFYLETMAHLSKLEGKRLNDQSTEQINKEYWEVVKIWRIVADNAYGGVFRSAYNLKLPNLPDYPTNVLNAAGDVPQAKEYEASYEQARQRRQILLNRAQTALAKETEFSNKLLLQTGRLRSKLLNELVSRGDYSPLKITQTNLQDFMRELRMVPSQWIALFYVKVSEVKYNLSLGVDGILNIATALFKLLIVVSIPVLLWLILKKLISTLNRLRIQLTGGQRAGTTAGTLASWSHQSIPYLRWLFVILAAQIIKGILSQTFFSELKILLPYVQIYCLYRIFRLLTGDVLAALSVQAQTMTLEDIQAKADESAKTLGRFLLISWWFLYAIQSIVSRALIYRAGVRIVMVSAILISAWIAHKWRYELAEIIESSFRGGFGRRLSKGCRGRFGFLWSLPAMIVAMAALFIRGLKSWSERFDVYKKISAKVFKQKIEITTATKIDEVDRILPPEYIQWFTPGNCDDQSVLVIPQNDKLEALKQGVTKWQNGAVDEQPLLLCGDQGSGKTFLMDRLEREFPDLNLLRGSVPPKLLAPDDVLSFLSDLLKVPLENPESLRSIARDMPKTLILIDNAQNLFLAKVGGFQAFKVFVDTINVPTKNLFWCVAINRYAWNYLERVFSRNRCFSVVQNILAWSETDIHELILVRHRKTNFRLSYDDILGAVGTPGRLGRISYVQSNFIRLLWQQANGNPQSAIYYWLSSLRPAEDGLLRVGLPEEQGKEIFSGLNEDDLFVYAEVVRHGNISSSEVLQATNLDDVAIKQALKEGVEKRILVRSENGRYRIATVSYKPLIDTLMQKNFVYGST